LEDEQFLGLRGNPCLATKYQNLWYTTNKRRQIDVNVEFFMYVESIQKCIKDTPCISPQLVEVYASIAWFREDSHHIYVQEKKDPREKWVHTKYKIME
jgi:hypothetical protein